MSTISQLHTWSSGDYFSADNLQADLAQLYDTINSLNHENLYDGTVFDFNGRKLTGVLEPGGVWDDGNYGDAVVNKSWLEDQLGNILSAGSIHTHPSAAKAIFDTAAVYDTDKVSFNNGTKVSYTLTSAERGRLLTADEHDALDNANSPDSGNPLATISDVTGLQDVINFHASDSLASGDSAVFSTQSDTKVFEADIVLADPSVSSQGIKAHLTVSTSDLGYYCSVEEVVGTFDTDIVSGNLGAGTWVTFNITLNGSSANYFRVYISADFTDFRVDTQMTGWTTGYVHLKGFK